MELIRHLNSSKYILLLILLKLQLWNHRNTLMWSKVDLQFLGNSFIPLEKGVVRWHGLRSLVLWPLYLRADKLSQSPFLHLKKKWANYGTVVLMQWDNMFRQLNRKTGTLHRLNQWIPAALIFIIFFFKIGGISYMNTNLHRNNWGAKKFLT